METLIRSAMASDIETLTDLSRRTITASYRPFLGEAAVDAFLGSGAADRYVAKNVDRCLVVVREARVVGYAVYRDNLIDLMMIDYPCQRQGLGTELLRHVEERLCREYEELRLESFEANQPGNAFYRKNGWREVGSCIDEISGVNKIVFRKVRP
jgi:ribosomal protein S18 acetylase RimI-like enzyme